MPLFFLQHILQPRFLPSAELTLAPYFNRSCLIQPRVIKIRRYIPPVSSIRYRKINGSLNNSYYFSIDEKIEFRLEYKETSTIHSRLISCIIYDRSQWRKIKTILQISLVTLHLSSREKSSVQALKLIVQGRISFFEKRTLAGSRSKGATTNSRKHLVRGTRQPPRQNTVKERINVIYRREHRLNGRRYRRESDKK